MWMQIVGKTRLALAPRQNHWWHVPLYLTSRGLTTTPMPYGSRTLQVEFDFVDHRLVLETSDGASRATPLRPQAVAEFYREYQGLLSQLGVIVKVWPVPVEVEHPIPFAEDRTHASYERTCPWFFGCCRSRCVLKRFCRSLSGQVESGILLGRLRSRVTRLSPAERPSGMRAMGVLGGELHEEISSVLAGSGVVPEPAFYAYARPEPPGLADSAISPAGAYYERQLSDFILPYEAVRGASFPDAAVLEFYQSAYDGAATLARWDRAALDRPPAEWP